MKSKPEFETPFEDSLAEFEMAPLPPDWRKDLIDNALSESARGKAFRFPSFGKIGFGVLAACWVATAILHFTKPTDPDFPDGAIVRSSELAPHELSLVVAYFTRPHPAP